MCLVGFLDVGGRGKGKGERVNLRKLNLEHELGVEALEWN